MHSQDSWHKPKMWTTSKDHLRETVWLVLRRALFAALVISIMAFLVVMVEVTPFEQIS